MRASTTEYSGLCLQLRCSKNWKDAAFRSRLKSLAFRRRREFASVFHLSEAAHLLVVLTTNCLGGGIGTESAYERLFGSLVWTIEESPKLNSQTIQWVTWNFTSSKALYWRNLTDRWPRLKLLLGKRV